MNEEEIKIKMDDRVDTSLASEGIDLLVDLCTPVWPSGKALGW